jgi:hypothetical protein
VNIDQVTRQPAVRHHRQRVTQRFFQHINAALGSGSQAHEQMALIA